MATGRPTRFKWQHRGSVTHSTLLHMRSKLVVFGWIMVSFREKWLTMDASCHAKYINHHCWFDALALIMQTGYGVDSLSVPVISHINYCIVCCKNHLVLLVIITHSMSSYPFFICSRGSSTPFFTMARGSTTPFFQRPKINPDYNNNFLRNMKILYVYLFTS